MNSNIPAKYLGIYRGIKYHKPKKPDKDWKLKQIIEETLREYPSYGSRRIVIYLKLNRKKVKRVMNMFGIRPYRRRCRKWRNTRNIKVIYPNILMNTCPAYINHIWTADFTHLNFQGRVVYIATVMDLYTRRIVGIAVYTNHGVQLVLSALMNALHYNSRPLIFHSDNGSEYNAEVFIKTLANIGTLISRSKPGCPWENGYQESFHSQFKVDLGDPNRFKTLGELVCEVYQTIYKYNNIRIHTSLKMSPVQFARKTRESYNI
jgi:transposase InsO family protein